MFTAQQAWSDIGRPETGNTTPVLDRFDPIVLLLVGVLVLHLFLFLFRRVDRIPAAYTAFAIVSVITALASGRLQSIGRYLAVAWPFDWILANRRAAWFELAGLAAFAALFVIHARPALHAGPRSVTPARLAASTLIALGIAYTFFIGGLPAGTGLAQLRLISVVIIGLRAWRLGDRAGATDRGALAASSSPRSWRPSSRWRSPPRPHAHRG